MYFVLQTVSSRRSHLGAEHSENAKLSRIELQVIFFLPALFPQESRNLFCCLYRSWCHNPVTTVSLCFLTQNYKHAYDLIQKLYPFRGLPGSLPQDASRGGEEGGSAFGGGLERASRRRSTRKEGGWEACFSQSTRAAASSAACLGPHSTRERTFMDHRR